MKGGYDLYGNYYPNLQDAIDAEIEQMIEIGWDKQREAHEAKMMAEYEKQYEEYLRSLEESAKEE